MMSIGRDVESDNDVCVVMSSLSGVKVQSIKSIINTCAIEESEVYIDIYKQRFT